MLQFVFENSSPTFYFQMLKLISKLIYGTIKFCRFYINRNITWALEIHFDTVWDLCHKISQIIIKISFFASTNFDI